MPRYRSYDHRLKRAIATSRDPALFPELAIPRSTALGWIRRGAHWVPPRLDWRAWRSYWAFRRELPVPTPGWLLRTEVRAIAQP